MLMAPNTGKRGEKRIEGGDELDARQGVDSSAHLKLEEDTVLTAGTASRRGTRLSSIHDLAHVAREEFMHEDGQACSSHKKYLGLVILLYKLLSRTGAGGSEKGSRRAMPVR